MSDGVATVGRRHTVVELLLLDRLSSPLRAAALGSAMALAAWVAWASLPWQASAAQAVAAGATGRWVRVVAQGSAPYTAWEGWAAALFFASGVARLRGGTVEPPAGRRPIETLSVAALRAALLREYTLARCGLVALSVIALADGARAARYAIAALRGSSIARSSLAATAAEAAGLVVAALVLALWAGAFRSQLERLGAVASS